MIEISSFWLSQVDSGFSEKWYRETFEMYCNWMAVEIFDDRRIKITNKETDVWTFGMMIFVSLFVQLNICLFLFG